MTLGAITSTSVIACGGQKPTPPTSDTRTDIEKEITSTIALGQLDTNTKTDFLDKLQTALVQIPNLSTITPNDYDVYKAGTITSIQDNDIIAGNSLNIKIVAKGNKFKGNKDNITTNYTQKDTKTDLSTITQLTGLDLVANSSKKFSEFKITICTTADQFKNRLINPSFSSIAFYDSSTSTNDIKSQNQRSGDF
ncbi:hypothetical protein PSTG_18094 [Puccinia striiformis f. sp. tritici PST-78]|uniref:Uncharacterized protein n=1 Tax=Puccinia striiformis f. sp. tritici PST-78 TaxID=1165861 RepID=A0A0L0UN69_9BASI|nr:hypothetical protein PSTG_18094 [Puccinia striiformis f. sp. tritici PST-78]